MGEDKNVPEMMERFGSWNAKVGMWLLRNLGRRFNVIEN